MFRAICVAGSSIDWVAKVPHALWAVESKELGTVPLCGCKVSIQNKDGIHAHFSPVNSDLSNRRSDSGDTISSGENDNIICGNEFLLSLAYDGGFI